MTSVNLSCRRVVNVLIRCAVLRRYLRRYVRELRRTSIDFSVRVVTRIILITCIVSFVSRFTLIIVRMRMMINGLDVIIVRDGYVIANVESYRV